jgi:hypothetical protein
MRRAAREVRRLKRALGGAVSEREEQVRVRAFEARDRWPSEAVDRLRIALPGYIPRSPLPWPFRVILRVRYLHSRGRYREALGSMESGLVASIRHRAVYALSHRVGAALAGISATVDDLALGIPGGLPFRLDRSAHHVRALYALLRFLRVGRIPTWVSYDELVQHGLAPVSDRMRRVGSRLRTVRARMHSVAATVEAAVSPGQAAAMGHNAALLRRAAANAAVALALLVLAASTSAGRATMARLGEVLARLIAATLASLPTWATRFIDDISAWLQSWLP